MSRSLQIKQEFNILDDLGVPIKECGMQVYVSEEQGKDKVASLFNKVSAAMGEFIKENAYEREQEKAQQEKSPFDFGQETFEDEVKRKRRFGL